MTDRADDIAREIAHDFANVQMDARLGRAIAAEIAAALRSYRNEGLEEAARVADRQDEGSGHDWSEANENRLARDIASSIRALKSKEPQG